MLEDGSGKEGEPEERAGKRVDRTPDRQSAESVTRDTDGG